MAINEFTLSNAGVTCFFEVMNVSSAVNQQWGRDNSRITVAYQIAWADRFKARELLLGKTTRSTISLPDPDTGDPVEWPYLSRSPLPHRWIEDEANDLYCTAVTGTEGLATRTQPLCYDKAIITCNYEQLPFEVLSDDSITAAGGFPDEATLLRFVEYGDRHSTGRLLKAYGLGLFFCNDADGLPNTGGTGYTAGAFQPNKDRPVMNGQLHPIYEDTIPYVWHQVPLQYAPLAIAAGTQNKMNSVTFDGFPARTLLYMGYRIVRTRLPQASPNRAVNIQYEFKFQRNGWDSMPDPLRVMRWYRVRGMRDPAKTMFEEADFADLFRPL